MKLFFILILAAGTAFAETQVTCTGAGNSTGAWLHAYPANNGTPDYIVSFHNAQGLEYNYVGALSLRPRTGVALWISARGVELVVKEKLTGEDFRRATFMADHSSQTYTLVCAI